MTSDRCPVLRQIEPLRQAIPLEAYHSIEGHASALESNPMGLEHFHALKSFGSFQRHQGPCEKLLGSCQKHFATWLPLGPSVLLPVAA